jgi:hypothetical protein
MKSGPNVIGNTKKSYAAQRAATRTSGVTLT